MKNDKENFIPAARFNFLTRFYDPLVRITTREATFKSALIKQANLKNGQNILDLACGTGSLSIAIKNNYRSINISAIDADAEILKIAEKKAVQKNVEINFKQGSSDKLPYKDATFDRVFSTLAFHHLRLNQKIGTLSEIKRVLKTGGEFHLADYGLPKSKSQYVLSRFIANFDGHETTIDNLEGKLGLLIEQSGFGPVEHTGYFKTLFGTIRLFRALK